MINPRRKRQTVCFRLRADEEKHPQLNTNHLSYSEWLDAITMVHHQWKVVDEINLYQQTHPHG